MERFVNNEDLLYCLGGHIKSTQLLYALCLTSKLFNACFTPFLYRSVATHSVDFGGSESDSPDRYHCGACDDKWPPAGFGYDIDMDRNPNVKHVRDLKVGLHTGCHDRRNPALLDRLLSKMPKLQHLEVNTAGDVSLLYLISSRHPGLKSLRFDCEDETETMKLYYPSPERLIGPNPLVNFSIFTSLTSLTIGNFQQDGAVSGPDLVVMLLAAPRLRNLALDCYFDMDARQNISDCWNPLNLMHDLCQLYRASGGVPLKLRSLRIGPDTQLHGLRYRWQLRGASGGPAGMFNYEDVSPYSNDEAAAYLEHLCDLSVLEELAVHNQHYDHPEHDENQVFLQLLSHGFAWDTFTKQRAPRLRQLWVSLLDDDVFDWIRRNVVSSDGYGEQITIRYGRQRRRTRAFLNLLEMGWRPKELEIDLDSIDLGYPSRPTHIDLIVECGLQLEGLCLVPDFNDARDDCKVYGGLIAQLPRLEVFLLRPPMFCMDRTSLLWNWPGFAKPNPVLLANLVRESCSLRYIMVGPFAWRVLRNPDGRATKLQGMGCSEWEDVELFRPLPLTYPHDDQATVSQQGYRNYQRSFWSPRRAPDLVLP